MSALKYHRKPQQRIVFRFCELSMIEFFFLTGYVSSQCLPLSAMQQTAGI